MGRFLIVLSLFICHASFSLAQNNRIVRGDCTPPPADEVASARKAAPKRLPSFFTGWSADKVYRQLVVLVTFSDCDFQMEKPRETYDSIFNYPGFNERQGPGCVAEYFREQSGGLCNLQFDVVGPIQVNSKAQPFDYPSESTRNYGKEQLHEATMKLIEQNPEMEFAPYDWNNNGYANQVIYVLAGYCGNQNNEKSWGYVWPNTSTFSTIFAPDGTKISQYSASSELWINNRSCGIGTICHEYTHCLGLPDLYPTNGWMYSAVDEWDLMDGGNFTNYGWCPPNYSALEKMLLGWQTPTELDSPKTITGMKPVSEGGEVFRVKHTDTEYLLLENRQWTGWDKGLPGKGLLIVHVNYNASPWSNNTVNNVNNKLNYSLIHADNLNYNDWYDLIMNRKINNPYQNSYRMNNMILSTTTYPWATDSTETVNDALTDISVPSAEMLTPNEEGTKMLQKPITDIVQHEDGTISFNFMGGDSINAIRETTSQHLSTAYDLQGRRIATPNSSSRQLYLMKQENGTIRKVFK